jgi:hypothetical protein
MRKRAYMYSRNAVWSQVAREYLRLFEEVRGKRASGPRHVFDGRALLSERPSLPELRLDHLIRLTHESGIVQHATFSVPNYLHGYCIDDNARALIVAVNAEKFLPEHKPLRELQLQYLGFLQYAFNEANGYFRNLLGYNRQWLEEKGSEDAHGRSLWGLGVACAMSEDPGCVGLSTKLFHRALGVVDEFGHPRGLAFSLVGMHEYLRRFSGDTEVRRARALVANRLYERFRETADSPWPWFQDTVTYANAKIPQALLLSGLRMQHDGMMQTGLRILDWLIEVQTDRGHFCPIGNDGWLTSHGHRARFDQQPIEAQAMIDACLLASQVTKDERYADVARQAFHWFLGENDLNVALYDYSTAGCRDGLQPDGPNFNQGAESTLAWLLSLIAMLNFEAGQFELQYLD